MRKWLAALVLLAMVMSLYACGGETPANTTPDTESSTAIDEETAETAVTTDTVPSAESDINKTEFIVYEDRIFFISKSSPEVETRLTNAINGLFRALPDGQNKYLMVAPMRIAFEVKEVQALSSDQKAEIKNIYLAVDPSVTLVDVYYALEQHAAKLNDIFFRTDHHWTHLGSYYAAQALFEAAGISYHKIGEYEMHDGGEFLGYLEDLANDPYFYDKPDTIQYYLLPGVNREIWTYYKNVETGKLEKTVTTEIDDNRQAYEKFLGANGFSHVIIFGDETSDRSLLLVGNSYSNAISTWLADSYKTVIVVDPRYFVGGKESLVALMNEYNVTDTLVLVSTSDSAALTDYFSYYLELLTR
jgi:predicted small lipoprotein YifL